MAVIAGIDEAGYGPTLGPLVVTGIVFDIPDDYSNKCLWQMLGNVVTKNGQGRRGDRIIVNDSKKVYSSCGLKGLEEGTLSFLWSLKGHADSFLELLKALSCYDGDVLGGYPWYVGKDFPLPIASNPLDVENKVQLLARTMSERGIKLHGIRSVSVSTVEFNRQIDLTGNKSLVLFQSCVKFLTDIWKEFGTQGPMVFVDKHGGRNKYHHLLSMAFPECQIKALKEASEISTYEIKDLQREMVVSFIEKAEDGHFPVALASMCSKYVRELFIKLFNEYWQERIPGLKPTAGYPLDAKRFLQQIHEVRKSCGITDPILVRKK